MKRVLTIVGGLLALMLVLLLVLPLLFTGQIVARAKEAANRSVNARVDWRDAGLEGFGKPSGYLERQIRRWSGLWEVNATRELGDCLEIGERLKATMPESPPATVVHGDYRFGNVMVAPDAPARLVAILDWEMATIGDPLADLGYLIASWSEPGVPDHPLLLSPVTEQPGFPSRAELVERYAERTGHDVSRLRWYEAFALWKASVFCEAVYGRYQRWRPARSP